MGMAEDNLGFALRLSITTAPACSNSGCPPGFPIPHPRPGCSHLKFSHGLLGARVSSCCCQCFYSPNAPKVLSLTCCVGGENQITSCVRTMSTTVPDLWMRTRRGHLCLKIQKQKQNMLSDMAHAPCVLVILGLFEFSCISDNWSCPCVIPG